MEILIKTSPRTPKTVEKWASYDQNKVNLHPYPFTTVLSGNIWPLSHWKFSPASPPSKGGSFSRNIVHCDCINRENKTYWLDFKKSKKWPKVTWKLKQNIKYSFSHAKNYSTSLKIAAMSIYEGIDVPWAASKATISFGRPTLRWDLYFLFANATWRASSPFLEMARTVALCSQMTHVIRSI